MYLNSLWFSIKRQKILNQLMQINRILIYTYPQYFCMVAYKLYKLKQFISENLKFNFTQIFDSLDILNIFGILQHINCIYSKITLDF